VGSHAVVCDIVLENTGLLDYADQAIRAHNTALFAHPYANLAHFRLAPIHCPPSPVHLHGSPNYLTHAFMIAARADRLSYSRRGIPQEIPIPIPVVFTVLTASRTRPDCRAAEKLGRGWSLRVGKPAEYVASRNNSHTGIVPTSERCGIRGGNVEHD
jgi:hypothetical protein